MEEVPGRSKKEQKEQKLIIFEEEDKIIYSSPSFLTVTNTYSTRNGWVALINSKLNSISLANFLPFFFVPSKLYHCTQFFSFNSLLNVKLNQGQLKGNKSGKLHYYFYFSATYENLFSQKIIMAFFLTFLPWYASIVYSVELPLDISTHW